MNSQTSRILDFLLRYPDQEISSVMLHRIGSGKDNGWCSSFTRRISDIRKLGHEVVMSHQETVNGQRHTFYVLRSPPKPVVASLTQYGQKELFPG